jgi:hypothetical protein
MKVTATYKLFGHYSGQTVTLNGFRFVEGLLITSQFIEKQLELLDLALAPYQGKRVNNGVSDVTKDGNAIGSAEVHGNDLPNGEQSQAGDSSSGSVEGTAETNPVEAALALVPSGDRPQESVDPMAEKIRAAVLGLDGSVPLNWTVKGQPALAAVERMLGFTGITRAQVEAVMPGYVRTVVKG